MNCPNCNIELKKNYCLKCGYMDNGSNIDNVGNPWQANEYQMYLKEDYEDVLANKNYKFVFIIGPLYLAYRNYPLRSYLLSFGENIFMSIFARGKISLILSFLISRFLMATFLNSYYLSLVKKDIIKLRQRDDFETALHQKKTRHPMTAIIVFLSFILPLIILYILIKMS